MPSGRGVASDNVYYLPLKEAVFSDKEKGPGIFAIDIERGKIVAQTRSKKDPQTGSVEVPGNLTFFDGVVISQSATEVVGLPAAQGQARTDERAAGQERQATRRACSSAANCGWTRASCVGAVEDLHAALKNNPPIEPAGRGRRQAVRRHDRAVAARLQQRREVPRRVQEALPGDAARPEDAEEAKETQRRKANFLCLVAKGREEQGKLDEALAGYLEFGSLPTAQDELLERRHRAGREGPARRLGSRPHQGHDGARHPRAAQAAGGRRSPASGAR